MLDKPQLLFLLCGVTCIHYFDTFTLKICRKIANYKLWKYRPICTINMLQVRFFSCKCMTLFQQIMTSVQGVGFPMEWLTLCFKQ